MKYSIDSITKLLYNIDPFGTYCREFQIHDEYESEAKEIYEMFNSGYGIILSIDTVLKRWYHGYPGLTQEEIELVVKAFD